MKREHSLRHTFVTRMVEGGAATAIVMALAGHSTASMSGRYSHSGQVALSGAVERAFRTG